MAARIAALRRVAGLARPRHASANPTAGHAGRHDEKHKAHALDRRVGKQVRRDADQNDSERAEPTFAARCAAGEAPPQQESEADDQRRKHGEHEQGIGEFLGNVDRGWDTPNSATSSSAGQMRSERGGSTAEDSLGN